MTHAPENQFDDARDASDGARPTSPSTPTPVTPVEREIVREVTEAVDQSELDLGVISTGSSVVDDTLHPLEGLAERPVSEHADVFERVLGDLSGTMADGPTDEPAGVRGVSSGGPGETAHAH